MEAEKKKNRPIIGISDGYTGIRHTVNMEYVRALTNAGALPVIIPFTLDKQLIAQYVRQLDGVLMIGGDDIHASHFGEEMSPLASASYPDRDLYDFALIKECVATGTPTLGICRGIQCMAVAFGGSIIQDLPSMMGEQFGRHSREEHPHWVQFEEGSFMGGVKVITNTHHHQAVSRVPAEFKVVGVCDDGIIEAIEGIGFPMWGVQFHPERMCTNDINPSTGTSWKHDTEFAKSIFSFFVEQCKQK
mgnify:FL=1